MSAETPAPAASSDLLSLAASIVAAYVAKNAIPVLELPTFISAVHKNLNQIATGAIEPPAVKPPEPAVPVKKSIGTDFIICLEDGKKFKSLRRHLASAYGLTPQAYRKKWGLAHDYPMVAPGYAAVRSELAKKAGLGSKVGSPRASKKSSTKAA